MRLGSILMGALLLHTAFAGTSELQSTVVQTTTPEEKEYAAVVALDEAAQAEVKRWREENQSLAANEAGISPVELERRIRRRYEPVVKAYLEFLRRYPNHVPAHVDYGCLLNEQADEAAAQAQWEKALELDPKNADACHNLAGRYAEVGPSKKAFDLFTRAIELKPSDAVYYHDFADTLYVLRSHAMTNYGMSEQQVFARALLLYSNAARLEPMNAGFAWDFADTYYALKPMPYDAALRAWTNALASAPAGADRERIYVHLARVKMLAGRPTEARAQLECVTNVATAGSKAAMLRALEERQRDINQQNKSNPGK